MVNLYNNEKTIKEYIEKKKFDSTNPRDVNLFQWELALQYGFQYQKYVKASITEKELNEDKNLVLQNNVPEEMLQYIELFCELDKEYKDREYKITNKNYNNRYVRWTAPQIIKDFNWRGYWMKATGNDFNIYIYWLKAGIKDDKYQTINFINAYLEEHVNAKDISDVPYAVKKANEIFYKYYKI